MTTALVTGASGFLGRALVARLRGNGWRVAAAGRARSALPPAEHALRLEAPDAAAIGRALAGARIDLVFHCAAYGVSPADRDPAAMFAANVAAPAAWAEAAAALGARAFVHVGSCAEYGTAAQGQPIREDAPLAARDPYGASKAAGAIWARARAAALALPFVWVRPFGIFGPGEAPHRLLPHLHARLRLGRRAALTPGAQMRDFLHVDDAAAGLVAIGAAALAGLAGECNLCSGHAVSVRAFAEAAARAMRADMALLDFGAQDYRPGETPWMVGDPARLAAATGFRPALSLEDGIARTVAALDAATAREAAQ
ncbi:MAG: NAD(P)-dependent oxidoreductase [Candidatus Odyssella sp.]|nr:NAD(P)-dependent oxidoreductase [Candidatus Odyssella sp.]